MGLVGALVAAIRNGGDVGSSFGAGAYGAILTILGTGAVLLVWNMALALYRDAESRATIPQARSEAEIARDDLLASRIETPKGSISAAWLLMELEGNLITEGASITPTTRHGMATEFGLPASRAPEIQEKLINPLRFSKVVDDAPAAIGDRIRINVLGSQVLGLLRDAGRSKETRF